MANKQKHLTEMAEKVKAKKFINEFAKENGGAFPSVVQVEEAQELTQEEKEKVTSGAMAVVPNSNPI